MRSLVSRFQWVALGLLCLAVAPLTFAAAGRGVEARLVEADGGTRVSVSINTPGVMEVKVVAFDDAGEPLGQYVVVPDYYAGDSCADLAVELPPDVEAKVHSVRVSAYSASDRVRKTFDSGFLHPTQTQGGCHTFCLQARKDCSYSCTTGSGEAVFSCGPDELGGCWYTCRCCDYPDCNGP
ncbi:MAG TPA: hypothetical protein VHK90_16045 [Thermoanaerobaculia bacterium]|nr:hypothetical protein [Thermoanaerobaculia bacterium]